LVCAREATGVSRPRGADKQRATRMDRRDTRGQPAPVRRARRFCTARRLEGRDQNEALVHEKKTPRAALLFCAVSNAGSKTAPSRKRKAPRAPRFCFAHRVRVTGHPPVGM